MRTEQRVGTSALAGNRKFAESEVSCNATSADGVFSYLRTLDFRVPLRQILNKQMTIIDKTEALNCRRLARIALQRLIDRNDHIKETRLLYQWCKLTQLCN